jgi:hypothetical protein
VEIVSVDKHIIAYDNHGRRLWSRTGMGQPIGGADGAVFSSSSDGGVFRLDARTGLVRRMVRACPGEIVDAIIPYRNGGVVWCAGPDRAELKRIYGDGSVGAPSAFDGGNLEFPNYIIVDPQHVVIYGTANGARIVTGSALVQLNTASIKLRIMAPLVGARPDRLYFASPYITSDEGLVTVFLTQADLSGKIIANDSKDFAFSPDEPGVESTAYVTDGAIFESAGKTLYRLDPHTANPRVAVSNLTSEPLAGRRIIVVEHGGASHKRISVLAASGKAIQDLPVQGEASVDQFRTPEHQYAFWTRPNGTALLNMDNSSMIVIPSICWPIALAQTNDKLVILCTNASNQLTLLAMTS